MNPLTKTTLYIAKVELVSVHEFVSTDASEFKFVTMTIWMFHLWWGQAYDRAIKTCEKPWVIHPDSIKARREKPTLSARSGWGAWGGGAEAYLAPHISISLLDEVLAAISWEIAGVNRNQFKMSRAKKVINLLHKELWRPLPLFILAGGRMW